MLIKNNSAKEPSDGYNNGKEARNYSWSEEGSSKLLVAE